MRKYKGEFNYYGTVFKVETTAGSEGKAKQNLLFQLSKLCNVGVSSLRNYFNSSQNNHTITKED